MMCWGDWRLNMSDAMETYWSNTVPFVRPYDILCLPLQKIWQYRLGILLKWWWNYRIRGRHYLRGELLVGEQFIWGFDNLKARERCVLIEARWNGEEWWVKSRSLDRRDRERPNEWLETWNEADNFRHSCMRMQTRT